MRAHDLSKPLVLSLMLALAPALLVGCEMLDEHDEDDDEPKVSQPVVNAPESEVLSTLVAINEHEIAASKRAREKATDAGVRSFADMLHADHTRNLEDTRAVAEKTDVDPHKTAEVIQLRKKLEKEREHLADLNGAAYDRAFIDAMVKGHQEVLHLIDDELMPQARLNAVKNHLEATRKHIKHHLERAQDLQKQMEVAAK